MSTENEPNSEAEYSPFHPEIDQQFPVQNLFSLENEQAIVRGQVSDMMWVSIFRNSPLNNSESEMIIGMFTTAAIRAGQWTDIALQNDVQMQMSGTLPVEESPVIEIGFTLEFNKATQKMIDQGFAVIREEGNGKRWLAPTPKLIAFVTERLKPYGPKDGEKEEVTEE
jgi:hypothetical protein